MIDGGIFLGRNPSNGNDFSEKDILAYLEKYSIQKALVASYKSIFFDFKEGNQEVIDFHKRHPEKIVPIAIIQPNGFDEIKDAEYLSYLRQSGFRVLGIFLAPKYYEIQLESPLLRHIAAQAAKQGLILQFGLQSVQDLQKVIDYYTNLPSPILIRWMGGRGYNALAEMIHAGQHYKNLYFDVGSLTCSGGIRHLVDSIGANRLYFTSNIPEAFELSSHFLLQTASLNSKEMSQVYFGTLQEVFSFDSKEFKSFNPEIWNQSLEWILNQPKIDTHWHTDGWNIIEPEKEYEKFKKEFDRFNYAKVVVSSIRALNDDLIEGNNRLFNLSDQDLRLYALVVVDPTRIQASLAEIEKYRGHKKCVGIKTIQDLYGKGLDDESYRPILEKAKELNLSVMAHIPGMLEAARRFPALNFICAHSTYRRVKHLFSCSNIYFDIATSHKDVSETKLEKFIKNAGEDRVLFASDGPLVSPAWTLGKLANLKSSAAVLKKILFLNARRIFPKLCVEIKIHSKNKKLTRPTPASVT